MIVTAKQKDKAFRLVDERRALYTPYALEKKEARCKRFFYSDVTNRYLKTEGWVLSFSCSRRYEHVTGIANDGGIFAIARVDIPYGI